MRSASGRAPQPGRWQWLFLRGHPESIFCSPGAGLHDAVETRAAAGVAAAAVAADAHLEPDGVLVAVDAHLDHALDLAAGGALAPQLPARARPVPGLAGVDGPGEGLLVHMRDHEDFA